MHQKSSNIYAIQRLRSSNLIDIRQWAPQPVEPGTSNITNQTTKSRRKSRCQRLPQPEASDASEAEDLIEYRKRLDRDREARNTRILMAARKRLAGGLGMEELNR